MEALKSWGITVCLAALAAGVAGIIAPGGKMDKVYKFAVSLFFLCCMLVPLFNLKNIPLGSVNLANTYTASGNNLDSTVKTQEKLLARQKIAKLIKSCCESCGVKPLGVDVYLKNDSASQISVDNIEVTLRAKDMPKKSDIEENIKNRLGITVIFRAGEK